MLSFRRRKWPKAGDLLLVFAGIAPGCEGKTHPQSHEVEPRWEATPARVEVRAPDSAQLLADYGPCVAVRIDDLERRLPRCIFDPEIGLRLWLDHPRAEEASISIDGHLSLPDELDSHNEPGRSISVAIPEDAEKLEIALPSSNVPWSLPLRSKNRQQSLDGDTLKDLDHVRFMLEKQMWGEGAQDQELWLPIYRHTIDLAGRYGMASEKVDVATTASFLLARHANRVSDAEAMLHQIEPEATGFASGRARLAYAWGILHWQRGRLDEAAVALRYATRHAVHTNEPDLGMAAMPMYAAVLVELGYFDAALHWAQAGLELVRGLGHPCAIAMTSRTVGWVSLLLRKHGESSTDPGPLLLESLRTFEPGGACADPRLVGGTRLSLAVLAHAEGQPEEALSYLAGVDTTRMTPDERVWALDTTLRSQLARGYAATQVRQTLADLHHSVVDADTPEARWHYAVRRGDVLTAEGDLEGAIVEYRHAEDQLAILTRLAALGVGRAMVGAMHRESTQRLVAALVERGETSQALCAARRAQARRIQAVVVPTKLPSDRRAFLQDRIDSYRAAQVQSEELYRQGRDLPRRELDRIRALVDRRRRAMAEEADALLRLGGRYSTEPACEDLVGPEPGELLLALYPNGEDWLVFSQDRHHTRVFRLRLTDMEGSRERLGELLLRPLGRQLEEARRVRVLAADEAQRVDVHLIPWKGEQTLITHVEVVYGADVAHLVDPSSESIPTSERSRALLSTDAGGSLPEAEAEIEHARRTLDAAGWTVDVLRPEETTSSSVRARMSEVSLFHYAGHAEHEGRTDTAWWPPYAGGNPAQPALLRLDEGEGLTAYEILMLSGQVPAQVVLAACRTGDAASSSEGMGLALAFLLAGAHEVIAVSGDVPDRHARDMSRRLYDVASTSDPWSLATAFRLASLDQSPKGAASERYRVWVP